MTTPLRRKRMIYMTDQEWAATVEKATALGISASLLVRDRVLDDHLPANPRKAPRSEVEGGYAPPIARAGFGHSSPAPKPGKR